MKGLKFEDTPRRLLDDALNVARLFTYFANDTSITVSDNKEEKTIIGDGIEYESKRIEWHNYDREPIAT